MQTSPGSTRVSTTQKTWESVYEQLKDPAHSTGKTAISRYERAMRILENMDNSKPIQPALTANGVTTLDSLNKLRVYVLTLGLHAFVEYKNGLTNSGVPSSLDKYTLPPFALVNAILNYFNYTSSGNHRYFIAQYTQLILYCMYRSRVTFFNGDVVISGNNVYIVVDDGFYDDEAKYKEFQTAVKVQKVFVNNRDETVNMDTIAEKLDLFDLNSPTSPVELVTGINFEKTYKFTLPGCQTYTQFNTNFQGNVKDSLLRRIQPTSGMTTTIMSAGERVKLAMGHYQCALAMCDVLLASMAQVSSQFSVDVSHDPVPIDNRTLPVFSGGAASPKSDRKSKVRTLGGGWNPFSALQNMLSEFRGLGFGGNASENNSNSINEIQAALNASKTKTAISGDNFRTVLPPNPSPLHMISVVTHMDKIRFGNARGYENAFIVRQLYPLTTPYPQPFKNILNNDEDSRTMQQIMDVGMAGTTTEMSSVVEAWIERAGTSDPAAIVKFKALWKPRQGASFASEYQSLYDIVYKAETFPNRVVNNIPSLAIHSRSALPGRVYDVYSNIKEGIGTQPSVLRIIATALNRSGMNPERSRKETDELNEFLDAACTELVIQETVWKPVLKLVEIDFSAFLDTAVVYMFKEIEPGDGEKRTMFVRNIVNIIMIYLFPAKTQVLNLWTAGLTQETKWTLPVRNYNAKSFMQIKKLTEIQPDLNTKFDRDEDSTFMGHSHFSTALSKLQRLDIVPKSDMKNVSSYSFVTMFTTAMDRVLAKLGSVFPHLTERDQRNVMVTYINDQEGVGVSLKESVSVPQYKDSLLSVTGFMYRDMFMRLQETTEKKGHNTSWLTALSEYNRDVQVYGTFDMPKTMYRPCLKMYNGRLYYACAWNFPLRILPYLNGVERDTRVDLAKIGCFNCNMYMVTPNKSFGLTPSAYHILYRERDRLRKTELTTDSANGSPEMHAKTNYEMMFAKPLRYGMDIMPVFKQLLTAVVSPSQSKDMKDALGDRQRSTLGFSDVNSWLNYRLNQATNLKPSTYLKRTVWTVVYTAVSGCYYVPQGARRIDQAIQGGADTVGALTLAHVRDTAQPSSLGKLYPPLKLDKTSSNLSPIVYAVFYYFNAIMGIRGELSPYIFTWYEAYNTDHATGQAAFYKSYFANLNRAKGFTIQSKMDTLGLAFPTKVDETVQDAQTKEARGTSSSGNANGASAADGSDLPDNFRRSLRAAGFLALFLAMSKCVGNSDLARDHRDECADAKEAIKEGLKYDFKARPLNPRKWERTMQQYPDYFTKKGGRWRDAHVVDPSLVRRDRAGNVVKRGDTGYEQAGMSVRSGNQWGRRNNRWNRQGGGGEYTGDTDFRNREEMLRQRRQYREAEKRADGGTSLNVELKNAQGDTIFRMLPHNLVANLLMLGFAGLTAWAASAGTSTYSRLLDVEFRKGNQRLADLAPVQPSRMACSFFFGMGLGIFVAFIASMVEMANHKRVRQVLFILLVALPVLVLGVIGVRGANNMCMDNPTGLCEENSCNVGSDGKGTCTAPKDPNNPVPCTSDSQCDPNYCVKDTSTCKNTGTTCDPNRNGPPPKSTLSSDSSAAVDTEDQPPPTKRRSVFLPMSKPARFPKLKGFWNSLMGQHDTDIMKDAPSAPTCVDNVCSNSSSSSCSTDSDCELPSNDVLKDSVKVSDYMFMGLGAGVLIAGICTVLPDNPFHPSKYDVQFQTASQAKFTRVSQVNPKWWIYGLIFSLIMAGAGTSSVILTHTDVPQVMDQNFNDVRSSGQVQSIAAVVGACVLFAIIVVLGWWHLKKHRRLARLMQGSSSSSNTGGRNTGTAANQLT